MSKSPIEKVFGKYRVTRRPDGTFIKWEKLNIPESPLIKDKVKQ